MSNSRPPPRLSFARSSSPTPSTRSTRSFLDEDPYPSSSTRRLSQSDHSADSSLAHFPSVTAATLLPALETLLRTKAEEIRQAGQLGSDLLAQQAELEARIRDLVENQDEGVGKPGYRRTRGESGVGDDSSSDEEKEVGEETRKRLQALEDELQSWDTGNRPLQEVVESAASQGVPTNEDLAHAYDDYSSPPRRTSFSVIPADSAPHSHRPAPTYNSNSLSKSLAGPSNGEAVSSAAARRARNGENRTNTVALATEIGQDLIKEIRRLQSVLAGTEEQLRESKEERDAVERDLESANAGRRTVEESVGASFPSIWLNWADVFTRTEKYKEENWDLELASQETRTALADAQTSIQKAEQDRTRLTKELASTREQLDTQRSEGDKLSHALEALKARHETDMATMRKHSAGLQREKSDLVTALDAAKAELATRKRGIKRGSSNSAVVEMGEDGPREEGESEEDEDVFRGTTGRRRTGDGLNLLAESDAFSEFGDDSPTASPVQRGALGTGPEALKAAMAHAQRTIATLRTSLAREKSAKMELRRQLADGGGDENWEESEADSSVAGTPVRPSPVRSSRGSARGRGSARRRGGGVGVPSRLQREFAGDASIDEEDEEMVDSFGQRDRGSIFEHQFPDQDDLSDEGLESPIRRANRVSLDMDPEFAHILDQGASDDDASLRSRGSPMPERTTLAAALGQSPNSVHSLAKSTRPSSGMFGGGLGEREVSLAPVVPPVVWSDASTMTDFPTPPPLPVIVPSPPVEVFHVGVQATAEPILAVEVPVVKKVDVGSQTEPEAKFEPVAVPLPVVPPAPVVEKVDFGAQTEPELKVVTNEVGIATDAAPALIEAGTSTDAKQEGVEMQVQTDPLPIPAPLPAVLLASNSMEDRALSHQPSLSTLLPTSARPSDDFEEANRTLTLADLSGLRGPPTQDSDSGTDRAAETDGEFEDARESIGVVSPTPGHTPSASLYDFASVKTHRTMDSVGSDIEVLKSASPRYKANRRAPLAKLAHNVVEVGVQTEPWAPQEVAAVPQVLALAGKQVTKRDSINTFGRSDSTDEEPLESSAATATAFLGNNPSPQNRALSPDETFRPDSVISSFSQQTDNASLRSARDKGKGPAIAGLMGPPPARVSARTKGASPRKSAPTSIRQAPPRPTSPPPADLLYRAQSPAFDGDYERRSGGLLVTGRARAQSSTLPPPPNNRGNSMPNVRNQSLRPQNSMTNSEYTTRSALKGKSSRRQHSVTSVADDMSIHSDISRRISMASSRTSEGGFDTPVRTGGDSTDPAVIHAITQTMIGEFLHKYTRRAIGKGVSEKRHKRFFWVHPYTKTLYWSSADPGAQNTNQSSAKSGASVFLSRSSWSGRS